MYGEKSLWRRDEDARAVAIMATLLYIDERRLPGWRNPIESHIELAIDWLELAQQRVAQRRELGKPPYDDEG